MAHANDSISKALFNWRPEQYVQRFMPGATFLRMVPTELVRDPVHADGLFRVAVPPPPPREAVLHIETQMKLEADLIERFCLSIWIILALDPTAGTRPRTYQSALSGRDQTP